MRCGQGYSTNSNVSLVRYSAPVTCTLTHTRSVQFLLSRYLLHCDQYLLYLVCVTIYLRFRGQGNYRKGFIIVSVFIIARRLLTRITAQFSFSLPATLWKYTICQMSEYFTYFIHCSWYCMFKKSCPFFMKQLMYNISTECPKIYRKYVLHPLKYRYAVYFNRCSKDLR